ncbi:Uncharacterised protein [Delftia tsuruhatensis]|nr:Uncharacterised protein [Delftia tsuruhatensis]
MNDKLPQAPSRLPAGLHCVRGLRGCNRPGEINVTTLPSPS